MKWILYILHHASKNKERNLICYLDMNYFADFTSIFIIEHTHDTFFPTLSSLNSQDQGYEQQVQI